jgi:hypothetical protein
MKLIKEILTHKLDGFDYAMAIGYGAAVSWLTFDGSAFSALIIQVGGLLAMKTLVTLVDRYQARKAAQ